MATLEELRESIIDEIQDTSISEDKIDTLINQSIVHVSRRVLLSELESSGVVSTILDTCEVVIPESWNLQRNLYSVEIEDKNEIKVLSSIAMLERIYPTYTTDLTTGEVSHVTIQGNNLIYYYIPTEELEFKCKFYEKPTTLVADSDELTCIPEGSQEELVENFVLWRLWKTIEDGIEGAKVNTNYHKNQFQYYLNELDDLINSGQSRPESSRLNNWI